MKPDTSGVKNNLEYHAEIAAYMRVMANPRIKRRKKTSIRITVIRIKSDGDIGNSRPCFHCLKFLATTSVSRIRYSDETGFIINKSIQSLLSDDIQHISRGNRVWL